jgi:hypothetical protein
VRVKLSIFDGKRPRTGHFPARQVLAIEKLDRLGLIRASRATREEKQDSDQGGNFFYHAFCSRKKE